MSPQSVGDAVISTDAEGRIEYLNPVAEQLTAWSLDEARGRPVAEVLRLVDEVTREAIGSPPGTGLGAGESGPAADHTVLVTRGGQEIAIQQSAAPLCDREGKVIGAVIIFHDVTKERRLKRALSYQATHDALTGLINRREFENRLHAALLSAQRGEGVYALLYADLDQFKVVNDTCGHPAGDRLLREVTALLQSRVRSSDIIARLGGDEFGILLESVSLDQARRIAEGIRQGVRDYRFTFGAHTFAVGASIGMVHVRTGEQSVAELMKAADLACYAAKSAGRNCIHVYEAGSDTRRTPEMPWVARIAQAPEEGRLELFFQPIVPPPGGRARGEFHELTVRLRADDGHLVPPGDFIAAAERYHVMARVDHWVVTQAIQLLTERRQRQEPLPLLAVNLSATSLNEPAFVDYVLTRAADPHIAGALCFEISEAAAVGSLSGATLFMRELKARGCRLTLDDFGSGLSSFVHLKTLPIDFVKIDGQFTAQIADDPVDRSVVEAICTVGRSLGIATIAGCVESAAALHVLSGIGVDFVQGFQLAPPRPLKELP